MRFRSLDRLAAEFDKPILELRGIITCRALQTPNRGHRIDATNSVAASTLVSKYHVLNNSRVVDASQNMRHDKSQRHRFAGILFLLAINRASGGAIQNHRRLRDLLVRRRTADFHVDGTPENVAPFPLIDDFVVSVPRMTY